MKTNKFICHRITIYLNVKDNDIYFMIEFIFKITLKIIRNCKLNCLLPK